MKTIYLLLLSILTATSLFAQNVEPTHKHVSYGSHKDMKLNFWKIEANASPGSSITQAPITVEPPTQAPWTKMMSAVVFTWPT